jgi:hypothetical protein
MILSIPLHMQNVHVFPHHTNYKVLLQYLEIYNKYIYLLIYLCSAMPALGSAGDRKKEEVAESRLCGTIFVFSKISA